jgi:hypothetical protein
MTGNGGPAASLPGTPRRLRPGAAIDDLICSLEEKWNLGLKVRGADWSPKRSSTDDTPDKICALVKFLYYHARVALNQGIEEFESQAPGQEREKRSESLRQILSRKKEGELMSRGMTPRNEPLESLTASFSGEYALAFYVPVHNREGFHLNFLELLSRRD